MAKVAFIFAALFCLGLVHQGLGFKCMDTLSEDGKETEVTCDEARVEKLHALMRTIDSGVTLPAKQNEYECLKAGMKLSNEDDAKTVTVKSCVYKGGDYCALKLNNKTPTDCSKCGSDSCNPAAKPVVSIGILSLVAVVALVFKY